MSRVIILGAGASYGTLEPEAPLAAGFGKYLIKKAPDWSHRYPYLAAAINFLGPRLQDTTLASWALDRVWGAIDNRVKLKCVLGLTLPGAPFPPPPSLKKEIYKRNLDPWGLAGFELRCVVAGVYGVGLDSAIQTACGGNGTVKEKLKELQPGDCVISFNYELLAETILKKNGQNFTLAKSWVKPDDVRDAILLCKPHGSLAWKQRSPENGRRVEILNDPMREDEIDFAETEICTVQPAIIGPVPFKSEIVFPELQLGTVETSFRLLVAQWHCALQCLSLCESLVILGYGFPPEDLHAQYLFADAGAKRKSSKTIEVEIYEKEKNRFEAVKREVEKVFKTNLFKDGGPVK
jgi:hypothetical protein